MALKEKRRKIDDEDEEIIDILSPAPKRRKIFFDGICTTFTIQHFLALEYAISLLHLSEPLASLVVYAEIVPYLIVDPQLKHVYHRFVAYQKECTRIRTFEEVLHSLRCVRCHQIFNENGHLACDDFCCKDCRQLFCSESCYLNDRHLFICTQCSKKYCIQFYEENESYQNDIRKCKECAQFVCMLCYDEYGSDVLCQRCLDDNVEIVDRVHSTNTHAQAHEEDEQEMDPLVDEAFDNFCYGEEIEGVSVQQRYESFVAPNLRFADEGVQKVKTVNNLFIISP